MAQPTKDVENKDMGMARNPAEKSAQNPGQTIEKITHEVSSKMSSMADDISETATDYMANTRSYVKENPLQSIAIAAASGLAVGTLLSVISKRKH